MTRWSVAGLYAITPEESDTKVLADKVRSALAGGAQLVQYRSKLKDGVLRRRQASELLELCHRFGRALIINDDLDLALSVGADGLHFGRDDGELAVARARLGRERLLGASCYGQLELAAAALKSGADYVAFGSAFSSPTKPGATRVPLRLYREAKTQFELPVVAIGGITPDNAMPLLRAGVDAVAVISALFEVPDIEAAARKFTKLFQGKKECD